jgi:hypothetical protein
VTIASSDRDERDIGALAEALRRGIASGSSDEQLEELTRATLGDDDSEESADLAADDPRHVETWFG